MVNVLQGRSKSLPGADPTIFKKAIISTQANYYSKLQLFPICKRKEEIREGRFRW